MRHSTRLLLWGLCAIAVLRCADPSREQPAPAPPAPSASASAPEPASPPPPAPVPAQTTADAAVVVREPIPAERWKLLIGRWVGAEKGDAIPGGPLGGTIVEGGARVEIEQRPHGKTPYNVTWWYPKDRAHVGSGTISGGCGFYPSGRAWCRGYGLPGVVETTISLAEENPPAIDQPFRLRLTLREDLVAVTLVRAH